MPDRSDEPANSAARPRNGARCSHRPGL